VVGANVWAMREYRRSTVGEEGASQRRLSAGVVIRVMFNFFFIIIVIDTNISGLFLDILIHGALKKSSFFFLFKVTHILNVAYGVENAFLSEFTYKNISILDLPETNILSYFPECFEFIEQARIKVSFVLIPSFSKAKIQKYRSPPQSLFFLSESVKNHYETFPPTVFINSFSFSVFTFIQVLIFLCFTKKC
jgi:hypothetical protein